MTFKKVCLHMDRVIIVDFLKTSSGFGWGEMVAVVNRVSEVYNYYVVERGKKYHYTILVLPLNHSLSYTYKFRSIR